MKRTGQLNRKTPLSARKPMQRRRKETSKRAQRDTRWRSSEYLAWIRSLSCCRCGGPGGDPHHVIGLHWGLSGGGLTAPDNYAMPLCRECHRLVHADADEHRYQPNWLRSTIARGVRELGGEIRTELVRAWEFIDAKEEAA